MESKQRGPYTFDLKDQANQEKMATFIAMTNEKDEKFIAQHFEVSQGNLEVFLQIYIFL